MSWKWFFVAVACASLWLSGSVVSAQQQQAYREVVTTPHVAWTSEAGAPVRVLTLVNYLAGREPAELAQRFPFLEMQTVPVTGNAYKNNFDEAFLTSALEDDSYDVIVIAAAHPWRDLSEKAVAALRSRVETGTPLVIFGRSNSMPSWGEKKDWQTHDALEQQVTSLLPVGRVPFRGKFGVQQMSLGKSSVYLVREFDQAFVNFNAFVARGIAFDDDPVAPEIYYGIAAQVIRAVAGSQSIAVNSAKVEQGENSQSPALVMALADAPSAGSELRWSSWSRYGQLVAKGQQPIEAGVRELRVPLSLTRADAQILTWRIVKQHDESVLSFGAAEVPAVHATSLGEVTVPDTITHAQALPIKWSLKNNTGSNQATLEAQIYDPDGRLVSWSRQPANAATGTLTIPAWPGDRFSTYQARVLLLDGQNVIDEHRVAVNIRLDRVHDLGRFHVIVWGTERGAWVERSRHDMLRQLGITALAPIGVRPDGARLAAERGLRLVPTNIYGPPSRFTNMARYSRERDEERLARYTQEIAKYTPLGYSLADEPSTSDYVAWRNRGQEIIQQFDPGALVGYCGVKLRSDDDLPGFFKAIDFLEMYSPLNLYTPDLWMGIERDKFRSFRRDDAIVTSWTHYAPKRDHEPYSRTVPWLWLFEEKDGVSYFDSAGNFAILNPDMTTTHETRWWREEVGRLNEGIAEQILAMHRNAGHVRIVLLPHSQGENVWARALNEMGIAYRFTTAAALAKDDDAKLAIWPYSTRVPADAARVMASFVARGGSVIVMLPLTMADETDEAASAQRMLGETLGINWPDASTPTDLTVARQGGVPAKVSDGQAEPVLMGKTTGQSGITAASARVQGRFDSLGIAKREDDQATAAARPAYIQRLFDTPAMLRRQAGNAFVTTLMFEPDLASAKTLLREHGADTPRLRVDAEDFKAPVYTYHMQGQNDVQMLGYIADYWRAGPDLAVEGGKQTAGYFHHGPQRWLEREAQLTLPSPRHVYDVRRGKYLGQGDRFTVVLNPAKPGLLSMLSYQVQSVTMNAPATIEAGQTLQGELRLNLQGSASNQPGMHVVHVTLQPESDDAAASQTCDVHVQNARGSVSLPIAYNASPGQWTLRATDALTGVTTQQRINITKPSRMAVDVLGASLPAVKREVLDWPQGQWLPASEVKSSEGVNVSVRQLERKRQHSLSGFRGDWAVMGGFSLANPEITYRLRYMASNDHEKHGWKDERRIDAPYLPGLGFQDPRPHMWYVNGFVNVYFDDVCVTAYRLSRMEKVEKDGQGRVEVTWDTPYGKIDLAFVLLADDIAMFQEAVIQPTVEFNTLELRFRSYPNGFGQEAKGTQTLREINEAGGWALLGNRDLDPAYNKGMGSGAMLILPDEWDETEFGRGMVGARLKRVINPAAAPLEKGFVPAADAPKENLPPIQARWALWMFHEMGNAEALQYMDVTADETRRRLTEIYPNRNK